MKRAALKRWIPFRLAALVAPLIAAWPQMARSADIWWDNVGGTANDWGGLANWSSVVGGGTNPGAIPGAADIAIFNATSLTTAQTVNVNADRTLLGLSFTSGAAVTLQAGGTNRALTLGASGIVKSGAGAMTIGSATTNQNVNVRLAADQTWANNNNTGILNIINGVQASSAVNRKLTLGGSSTAANVVTGVIANNGAGVLSLDKTGAGRWVLAGANTFSGAVNILSGTMVAQNSTAFGTTAAGTTVASGAALELGGALAANALNLGGEVITVSGTGVGGTGALLNTSANDQQNAVQQVVLAGDTSFGGSRRWDIRSGTALGASLNGNGFSVTKVGANYLPLVNVNVANVNQFRVQNGTMAAEVSTVINSSNVPGGVLVQPAASGTAAWNHWGSNLSHSADYRLDSTAAGSTARLEVQNGVTTFTGTITATGNGNVLDVDSGWRGVVNGVLAGDGAISKNDTGALLINGNANTHSGAFTISAGALGGVGTLSSPTVNWNNGASISPGDLTLTAGTLTLTGNVISSGTNSAVFNVGTASDRLVTGAFTQNGTTAITVAPGAGFGAGTYPLISYSTLDGSTGAAGFSLGHHLNGSIQNNAAAGTVDLVVKGTEQMIWTGASNGILVAGSLTNPVLPNFSWLGAGAEFVNGDSIVFNDSAAGSTSIVIPSALTPGSITFDNSAKNYTIDGPSGFAGSAGLVKTGSGTLTFLANQSITGPITVEGGTLQLGSDSRAATLPGAFGVVPTINLAAGTTLALSAGSTGEVGLSSNISGSGRILLNSTQNDTLHNFTADRGNMALRGDNSGFTGEIVIPDGNRLRANSTNALGNASSITIENGGALLADPAAGGMVYSGRISVGGRGWQETGGQLGALRLNFNTVLSGPVTLTSDTRISAAVGTTANTNDGTISGVISGPHALEVGLRQIANSASGTITLSNPANTYTGDTSITRATVNAATIADAGQESSLGKGSAINLEVGTLLVTGAGPMSTNRTITVNQGGQGGGIIGTSDPSATLTVTGKIVNGNANFPVSSLDFINGSATALGTGGTVVLNTVDPIVVSSTTVHRQNLTLAGNTSYTVGYPVQGSTPAPFGYAGGFNLGNSTSATNAGPAVLTVQDNAVLTTYGNFDAGNQNPGFVPGGTGVTILQTGGTVNALRGGGSFAAGSSDTANRAMRLGHWQNGDATYALSGGTLNVPNGYVALAWDGNGTINQSGTSVANLRGLRIGNSATSVGKYNLAGGTLNVGDLGILKNGAAATHEFNMDGGTLKASADFAISSGLPIYARAGGAIIDTNGFTIISASAILDGGGGLVKNGNGLLELPAGNTYTGATVVNAGSLGGSAATFTASNVTVNSGASVSGSASFLAANGIALTVNARGSVSPGAGSGAGIGTITATTLRLAAGSQLNITPGAPGAGDLVSVTAASGLVTPSVNPSVGKASLNVLPIGVLEAGTYDLVLYNTAIGGGGFAGINANLPHLINGVVTDDGAGKIQLTHAGQETMTWTGASGGSWDTSSTNFSGTVTGPDSFLQGDVVVFDTAKSPAETAVSVAGSGVTPASVSINDATGSFSFTGGSINGGGGITKTGAGRTILATDNTNTGTTTISAGTLQIGNGGTKGALGSGSVVNDGTLAVNKSSQTVLTGAISGTGVLRNDGTGRTILPRDNSYGGGTVISKGTMEGRTAAAFGTGTITLGDASTGASDVALLFNPLNNDTAITVANPIVVAAGGTGRVTIGSGENSNVGAGLIFSAASTLTLNRDVTLTGDLDRTTWDGVISGTVDTINIAPSPTLEATLRPGRVSWSGANTFTPATAPFTTINVLDRAIFQLGQATTATAVDQVPDTAAVVVAAGGTLQFGIANDSETIGDLSGAGTVRNITNTALNLTFGTSRDTEFSGVLNGGNALSFIKQGSGTFTMSGNLDNPTGNITVNAGTVLLAKDSTPFVHSLGGASTVNSGGTLKLGGSWTYTRPESDGRAGVNSAPSNAPANYVDQIYNGSGITVNAGGVLDMNGRSEAVNTLAGAGTVTNSGAVPTMLYIGANNGDSTFTGILEDGVGGLGIAKMGTGVMTLSGASTYSGVTEIRSDNVTITDLQALGSTAGGTIIGTNRDNTGGTDIPSLTINVTTASTPDAPNIFAEPLTLRSETAGDQRSQVVNAAQSTRITGPIVVEGDGISQFSANQAAGSQFQINGSITGTSNGILFLRGAGEMQLNSVINAPALQLAKTEGSLLILNSTGNDYLDISLVHGTTRTDVPNAIDPTAILRMGQNGNDNTLDLNGNNQTVAGIRLNFGFSDARNRVVTNLSATPAILTINTPNAVGGDMNYGAAGVGGTIAGNLSLVKDGPGTQVLSAANTYTGTTTVNGGTLRIDGSITSATTVNRNGVLAGLGTVGSVDVTEGGRLRPSGILTTGAVTTRVGGLVEFSIGGTTAGTQYTRLNTIGAINVDSSTLVVSLTNGFVPAQFDKFTLWANDEADLFAGTFNGLLEGGSLPVAGTSGTADLDADYWMVSYTGDTGNDFVLTYIPEPGTAALLLAGGLPLLRRRRRAA